MAVNSVLVRFFMGNFSNIGGTGNDRRRRCVDRTGRYVRCQPFRYAFIGGPSGLSGISSLSCRVENNLGALHYVPVTLFGVNNIYRSAVTDSEGNVLFVNLPPGRYQVLACGCCKHITLSTGIRQFLKFCCVCYNCTGTINISLYSGSNGQPLAYGRFGIYNSSNLLIVQGITDEFGRLTFTNLPCATYTIREISAPPLYNATSISRTFTLSPYNFSYQVFNTLTPVVIAAAAVKSDTEETSENNY